VTSEKGGWWLGAQRPAVAVALLVAVFAGGTIGYMLIERWNAWDAFYMTIITVTTVGYREVHDLSLPGQVFTVVLLLGGVGAALYTFTLLATVVVGGGLPKILQQRRQARMLETISEHFIICGYGRVGQRVGKEFRASDVPYVVLDFSEKALDAARENDDLYVQGDGTEDEDLVKAGIDRARGLVAASDSDADNLYITLSARSGRPELTIVARASDEDAEKKLKLAGADRVVTPFSTAGRAMANLVLKPQVAAFLDVVTTAQGDDFVLEEIEVRSSCSRAGRTIRELRVRDETGAMIVALRKGDGTFDATPSPDALIDVGDVLIGVGTPEEIRSLEDFFAPQEAVVR